MAKRQSQTRLQQHPQFSGRHQYRFRDPSQSANSNNRRPRLTMLTSPSKGAGSISSGSSEANVAPIRPTVTSHVAVVVEEVREGSNRVGRLAGAGFSQPTKSVENLIRAWWCISGFAPLI